MDARRTLTRTTDAIPRPDVKERRSQVASQGADPQESREGKWLQRARFVLVKDDGASDSALRLSRAFFLR